MGRGSIIVMESVAGGSTIKALFRVLSSQWMVVSDQYLVTMPSATAQ
jgi:hypothetical protein